MQIAYVGGWMRSGTTLLCEMLGAFQGALAIGEVSGIWLAAQANQTCSCSHPVRECPVWGPALDAVASTHGVSPRRYGQMADTAQSVYKTRNARQLAALDPADPRMWPNTTAEFTAIVQTLLEAVSDASGASTLVDSSKLPPGFLIQRLMPNVTVKVVHIVRDPRAVANSERKTRGRDDGGGLIPPGRSSLRSVVAWSGFNVAVQVFGRYADDYVLVRYEDLVAGPRDTLDAVATRLNLRRDSASELLDAGHIAVGNPTRFNGSERAIAVDDSWRQELPRRERLLVGALGAPARVALSRAHRVG